jgi:hypothetical protein
MVWLPERLAQNCVAESDDAVSWQLQGSRDPTRLLVTVITSSTLLLSGGCSVLSKCQFLLVLRGCYFQQQQSTCSNAAAAGGKLRSRSGCGTTI